MTPKPAHSLPDQNSVVPMPASHGWARRFLFEDDHALPGRVSGAVASPRWLENIPQGAAFAALVAILLVAIAFFADAGGFRNSSGNRSSDDRATTPFGSTNGTDGPSRPTPSFSIEAPRKLLSVPVSSNQGERYTMAVVDFAQASGGNGQVDKSGGTAGANSAGGVGAPGSRTGFGGGAPESQTVESTTTTNAVAVPETGSSAALLAAALVTIIAVGRFFERFEPRSKTGSGG